MTQTAPPLTDPRPLFARAVITAVDCVSGVRPDQLQRPTPCTDYDVRHLLGHLVAVLDRVAAVGRGAHPFSVPIVAEGIPDDGWPAALSAAAGRMAVGWYDDAVPDRPLRLPFGTLPRAGPPAPAAFRDAARSCGADQLRGWGHHPPLGPGRGDRGGARVGRRGPGRGVGGHPAEAAQRRTWTADPVRRRGAGARRRAAGR